MAQKRLIGRAPPRAPEARLIRALAPMVRTVEASIGQVETPAQARALGAALRAAWPDAKIRKLVMSAGAEVERVGSRVWTPLERARARASKGDRFDAAEFDGDALLDKWSRDAVKLITSDCPPFLCSRTTSGGKRVGFPCRRLNLAPAC